MRTRVGIAGLLSREGPTRVFWGIVFGVLAGLAYALVIPLILRSLEEPMAVFLRPVEERSYHLFDRFEVSTPGFALTFLILCVAILGFQTLSQTLFMRVSVDARIGLRRKLYRRIAAMPIDALERIGSSKLLAALTRDVPDIVNGAVVFPRLLINAAQLVGLLAFLLYLNADVFLFVVSCIAVGAVTYQVPIYLGGRVLARAREAYDGVQEGIRGLLYGAKELKLNRQRRRHYLEQELDSVETDLSVSEKRGQTFIIFGTTYGNLVSFIAIGLVAYMAGNFFQLSRQSVVGTIMVMLYVTGPISEMIHSVAPIVRARVAARKVGALLSEMPMEPESAEKAIEFDRVVLDQVEYRYLRAPGEHGSFHAGPFDLELKQGEVVFIVGGNGSGKTTLGKLLSLHYVPSGGGIYLGDTLIDHGNRDACRQYISAVFSDFYLFRNVVLEDGGLEETAIELLTELDLKGKVAICDGAFSSLSLSTGQKKRLALAVAFLEGRDIYVFDEWAADQDPEFKKVFYEQICPALSRKNKLVVVITHDDRYFHLADKVVRMEDGVITDVQGNGKRHTGGFAVSN